MLQASIRRLHNLLSKRPGTDRKSTFRMAVLTAASDEASALSRFHFRVVDEATSPKALQIAFAL